MSKNREYYCTSQQDSEIGSWELSARCSLWAERRSPRAPPLLAHQSCAGRNQRERWWCSSWIARLGVCLVGAESEQSTLARKLNIVDSTASGSTWVNPEAVKAKLIIWSPCKFHRDELHRAEQHLLQSYRRTSQTYSTHSQAEQLNVWTSAFDWMNSPISPQAWVISNAIQM